MTSQDAALRPETMRAVVEAVAAVIIVVEAYGSTFAPVAVEVMMPERLSVPSVAPPTALSCPVIVDDAETESAEVVAPVAVRLVKSALVEKKLVEVALVAVALVTVKLLPLCVRKVSKPVFDTDSKVVDAPVLLVEPMAKRVVATEVEAAWIPKVAKGVVEPTPTDPAKYAFPVVVAPPEMVSPPVWEPLPIVEEAAAMML